VAAKTNADRNDATTNVIAKGSRDDDFSLYVTMRATQ
jgi:hypothetical protein